MGRPKGSRNKGADNGGVKSTDAITNSTAPTTVEDHDFGGGEREAMYDRHAEAHPPDSLLTGDDIDSDPLNSGIEVTESNDPLGDFTGTSTETEDADDSTETEQTDADTETSEEEPEYEVFNEEQLEKEVKTVPLDALHEEREKRKERDKQIDQLLEDNKKLMERLDGQTDEYGLSESDSETRTLKNKIAQLEERLEQRESYDKENQRTQAEAKTLKLVDETAKKLSDEGFLGFEIMGKQVVGAKLQEIAKKYGVEKATEFDNPEGWAKIWRAEQPKLKQVFLTEHKEGLFNSKKEVKKNANLITTPGRSSASPKQNTNKSVEDKLKEYAQQKAKFQLS